VLPNFFLAGANKAGTTSLYHYLAQHPQIFMCPVKEPCYFAPELRPANCAESTRRFLRPAQRRLRRFLDQRLLDQPGRGTLFGGIVENWDDYVRLFDGARDKAAIGEATPSYLWSESSARMIYDHIPDAKVVVMLRDPADRAFSHYRQLRYAGGLQRSFRQQIDANLGNRSKRFGFDYPFLEFGRYHEQLLRYYRLFPRRNVCVLLYDDYHASPWATVSALFHFLGVDSNFQPDLSQRFLEGHVSRFPGLKRAMCGAGIWQLARKCTPASCMPAVRRVAYLTPEELRLRDEDRRFLVDYYADDIRKTGELIGRDLSGWLRPTTA
jgi:hypothetical protein